MNTYPFGSIGANGWEMSITFESDIRIMGSNGVWRNIIVLHNLPWLLGKLDSTSAAELARALQKVIDDSERQLGVMV